jgi:hypothetical protein
VDQNLKNEIINYNKKQIEHMYLVKKNVWDFCRRLMEAALEHDHSKFEEEEYWTFVETGRARSQSKDGQDSEYQNALNSEAIQHHISINSHHPEFWDDTPMPIIEAIIMFFDWYSRAEQRGMSMEAFWEYNTDKLKDHKDARNLVEYLKKYYFR